MEGNHDIFYLGDKRLGDPSKLPPKYLRDHSKLAQKMKHDHLLQSTEYRLMINQARQPGLLQYGHLLILLSSERKDTAVQGTSPPLVVIGTPCRRAATRRRSSICLPATI
jgi:hypothetical protein